MVRRRRARGIAAGVAIAGCALAIAGSRAPKIAEAQAPRAAAQIAPVEIAIVATPHERDARASEVRFVRAPSDGARAEIVASIPHAPGAVVRGEVLPGTRAAVIAADAEDDRGDRDFGTDLFLVAGARVTRLARGLYHASRPLASSDGLVYVERGASGAWPTPDEARAGKLRTDALSIDAIDPATGARATLFACSGYTLHLAGEWLRELVVYRVDARGAELVAIDRGRGTERSIARILPYARDFSIDAARGAIVLSDRDERDARLWIVDRIDLATGARTRIAAQRDEALVPFATPGGGVALDGASHATADGAWSLRRGDGSATHVASRTTLPLGAMNERIEILGFVARAQGGLR